MMKSELAAKLKTLADKYECASFCDQDPSQFLLHYKNNPRSTVADTETAAFIAAMLAFGSRTQFIPKINFILELADKQSGTICRWLTSGSYRKDFATGTKKFYRFYSYDDMQCFFTELADILKKASSPGEYFKSLWEQQKSVHLSQIISQAFVQSSIVPKGKNCANKRIHMFLRWMVRQNSPVDLGIWSWYPQSQLIMPLDVHVMQQSVELGLIAPGTAASRKTAELLTNKMNEIFPGDPCRADFALFGLGVDS